MMRCCSLGAAMTCFVAGLMVPAWAQKNSGPLLPTSPPQYAPPYSAAPRARSPYASPSYASPAYAPPAYAPPAVAPPAYTPPATRPLAAGPQAGNPDAERLAQSLPLDPQIRELRDQLPADPRGAERRLGLREPRGPATDLRGRAPNAREIVDALAPR